MLTINELRDQFEIQGEAIVKWVNPDGNDEEIYHEGDIAEFPAGHPAADMEIEYQYSITKNVGTFQNPVYVGVTVYEVKKADD